MRFWRKNSESRVLGLRFLEATRQGWSDGKGEDDVSMKIGEPSSGCKTRPTKAEPGRSVASLAPSTTTAEVMRRYASG